MQGTNVEYSNTHGPNHSLKLAAVCRAAPTVFTHDYKKTYGTLVHDSHVCDITSTHNLRMRYRIEPKQMKMMGGGHRHSVLVKL